MKRIFSCVVCLAVAASLFGCGGGSTGSGAGAAATTGAAAASGAQGSDAGSQGGAAVSGEAAGQGAAVSDQPAGQGAPAAPEAAPGAGAASGKGLKAAIVFNGPVADGSWNADCYEGMLALESEYGYEIAFTENVDISDYLTAFRDYAAAGYDLVIGPGAEFQDAVMEIYQEFPDTMFAGINFSATAKNVSALNYDNYQAGFLFATLAGLMTKTDSVGYIYSMEIQPILDSIEGAKQGLEYTNPGCKLSIAGVGSFNDVAKAKELALSQITTANVDVIMPWAAAAGIGILEACIEKGATLVYGPVEGLAYSDKIDGCVIMSNSGVIKKIGADVAAGLDEGYEFVGDVSNGVIHFGNMSDRVSEEDKAFMQSVVDGLISGEIVIDKGAH